MDLTAVKKAFTDRGFAVSVFDTAQQATDYLTDECAGKTVSFGGSETLRVLGAYDALAAKGADVHWHWQTPGELKQDSEIYLTSANALSMTGEIVNIDGNCNRIAGAMFGCKTCFYVCGVNKLAPDLMRAISRARNVAAPQNARRLNRNTPCVKDGKCHDCRSSERICSTMAITMTPPLGLSRCEIVLIDATLGY